MTQSRPAPNLVYGYLDKIQYIFAFLAVAGAVLFYLSIDTYVLMLGLFGLSVTFFLGAYRRPSRISESDDQHEARKGFSDLFAGSILPKVLNISCSVMCIGLLFTSFGMEGDRNMLLVGGMTAFAGSVAGAVFVVTRPNILPGLLPAVLKAVPLVAISLYFLLKDV